MHAPPAHLDRLVYTVPEWAALFGVSRAHVHRLVARGEVRACKLGNATRIPLSEATRILGEAGGGAA